VAREAAGGTSEWKRHRGAGTKKIGWRCPFKGRDGEAAKGGGGPVVRTPHGVERAWGLAPIVSRLAAGEGGRREAQAEHGLA
jgi:hypothetical protein